MDPEVDGIDTERVKLDKEDEFIRKLVDPKLPTEKEIEEHRIAGHVEYRNWCSACVQARGRTADHKKAEEEERRIPEYSFDYCFPGDECGFKWTILVGKERTSKACMATTVPTKGIEGKFAVSKCLEFIAECGDKDNEIIIKSDQEPSIVFLMNDLVSERTEGRTMVEQSPEGSSSSNGQVEREIQDIEGTIRAILIGLEERLGIKIDARERIIAFIAEYAAYLRNRLRKGEDGKVAYERIKGKNPRY